MGELMREHSDFHLLTTSGMNKQRFHVYFPLVVTPRPREHLIAVAGRSRNDQTCKFTAAVQLQAQLRH